MTANEVDHALGLPAEELGSAVLGCLEDQWFDRKSAKIAPKDLGPILTAFANSEGGVIVVGASNGKVEGISSISSKINDFRQAPIDFTVPPVRATYATVDCINDEGKTDQLLVVRVDPSERVHELKMVTATFEWVTSRENSIILKGRN